METVFAVSAFLGAALVGLAADSRVGRYLDQCRWLRVTALAVAVFVVAAIVTGI